MTAAMNIIGFVEALLDISYLGLHPDRNSWVQSTQPQLLPPTSSVLSYTVKSLVLLAVILACIALGRKKIFSSMARSVTMILLFTLLSVFLSFLSKQPFVDEKLHMSYTGFSAKTLWRNLYPRYELPLSGPPGMVSVTPKFSDYQKVFGILFPSLSGILAGSSLSGELRRPSRSLPSGMILALVCILAVYLFTLFGLSVTCLRESFASVAPSGALNLVIYQISHYPIIVGLGILLCTLFSSVMGVTVCGKILQAVSRDGLIPVLKPFFSQGSQIGDDPVYSILFCYAVCQLAVFYHINKIAVHVTTVTLLVFACINLACFALRIAGSPNFRPSFRLFSEWTALLGLLLAFLSMYLVDPVSASTCLIAMIVLFVAIHYSSPAKQWGEVTQSIIYHQVRKYLLRLDERKDNVKYWRPQILLFTNDPRHDWNQIVFCNSLKKGGLYLLAHIIKSEFSPESVKELQEQQLNWLGLVDVSNIKAFVDITVAPDERVGARQLLLNAGLGGMRPNICILGFPTNLKWRGKGKLLDSQGASAQRRPSLAKRRSDSSLTVKGVVIQSTAEVAMDCLGSLPTDSQRLETPIKPVDFVGIIEDSLRLNKSVGLAHGFQDLRLPESISRPQTERAGESEQFSPGDRIRRMSESPPDKRWIDLWPLLREGESGWETYTMVLQLGTILSLVPSWRCHHALRVTIFCEHESEIVEERRRMEKLLVDLRIRATLRVCVLANGHINSYECFAKGKSIDILEWTKLETTLAGDPWWETLKFMRAQDLSSGLRGGPAQAKSTHPRPDSQSSAAVMPALDKSLLFKNSQVNNIRIKALHPLSRRGARPSTTGFGIETSPESSQPGGDDDEELILEENDGDDDTMARAAYNRSKKHSTPFVGLPDEPPRPRSHTASHLINHYGSTFDQQSLDLENLSPYSLTEDGVISRLLTRTPPSQGSTSSPLVQGEVNAGHLSLPSPHPPRYFKKIFQRNRAPKGLRTQVGRRSGARVGSQVRHLKTIYASPTRMSSGAAHSAEQESLPGSESELPVIELDFNSLPMRAQLICLNELIKYNTPEKETAIIFTSLPPPESGSCNTYEGSSRYLDQLESFLDGLPPVLAIHAKQFTVTASL